MANVQVIEQTSKRWKGIQAVGTLGMVVGMFGAIGGNAWGFGLIGWGVLFTLSGMAGAWWNHG